VAFFRRKRKEYHAPPPPSQEIKAAVADVVSTAELQRARADSRDEEIDRSTARLHTIREKNALGARFWQAAGQHRST
jgi:hypothetical protein